MTGAALQRVLEALEAHNGRPRQSGEAWTFFCPVHGDGQSPAGSLSQGREGAVLQCHAGCPVEQIVAALGLRMADLFDDSARERQEEGRWEKLGTYVYTVGGKPVGRKTKWLLPDGVRRFQWERREQERWVKGGLNGTDPGLYRIEETPLDSDANLYITEGESDCEAVRYLGKPAISSPHGAGPGKWKSEYTAVLAGYPGLIVVCQDRDEKGVAFAAETYGHLTSAGCSVMVVEPIVGKDVRDHLESGHTLDQLRTVILPAPPVDPIARTNGHKPAVSDTPPPPVKPPPNVDASGMPEIVRRWIEEESRARQCSQALPLALSLAALSTTVMRRVMVDCGGWTQELALYAVGIMGASERKTPIGRDAVRPIQMIEREMYDRWEHENAGLDDKDRTPQPGILTGDTTSQALFKDMAVWGEKACVVTGEGSKVLSHQMGVVGGAAGIEDLWLSARDGEQVKRRRADGDHAVLYRPQLALGIGVQAGPWETYLRHPGVIERGAAARWLAFKGETWAGHREVRTPPMDPDVQRGWERLVHGMWDTFAGVDVAIPLRPEAQERLLAFEEEIEPKLDPVLGEWRSAGVSETAGKLAGTAARVATIIHLVEHHGDGSWKLGVGVGAMDRGIGIAEQVMTHALYIYGRVLAGQSIEDTYSALSGREPEGVPEILAWLAAQEEPEHPVRIIFRRFRRHHWCKTAKQLEALLKWMGDEGFIGFDRHTTGGRPSWVVSRLDGGLTDG